MAFQIWNRAGRYADESTVSPPRGFVDPPQHPHANAWGFPPVYAGTSGRISDAMR
jgi:hypothetical protein